MSNIFSKLELSNHYEETFDELCCHLESFSEGLKFINEDITADIVAVTEQLMCNLHELNYSDDKVSRFLLVFNAIQFYLSNKLKNSSYLELKYSVSQESNLLASLLGHEKESTIDLVLNKIYTANYTDLKNRQRFGLLTLLLATECGVFSKRNLVSLISSLLSSKSITRIENLYFVDFEHKDLRTNRLYPKRVFIGPLTLSLLFRKDLLNDLSSIIGDSKIINIINSSRLLFLNNGINKSKDKSFTTDSVNNDLLFFSLYYLPGYLQQIAYGLQDSFSISLQDFAKLHGIYIPAFESVAEASGDDDDDDDDTGSENTGTRFIKSKYFSKLDFIKLIDYLSIHPTVSNVEFRQFEYILNLCFYLGLRRSEALFLRKCDIFDLDSFSAPASLFVRKYIGHTVKSDTSNRHQPLSLLPEIFANRMASYADEPESELIIGRFFSEVQAIYFFDRLSKLMQECLGSKFSLHICRHSYISRGLLLSEFKALNLQNLATCSAFIREIAEDHERYRDSFRLPDITMQHLTNLSQSAGHATVRTTLRHYCHSTDLLIFGALNSRRPEGYAVAVSHYSGISERSLKRWRAENMLEVKVMEKLSRSSPHVCHYTTPLMPISALIKQSYMLYKQVNIADELSSRELEEWVRLYIALHALDCVELVRFIDERLVDRGSFMIYTKSELKDFRRLIKCRNSSVACCWEVSQPKTVSSSYVPLSANNDYTYPMLLRIDYSGDASMDNAPRRIFPMLIRALISRNI